MRRCVVTVAAVVLVTVAAACGDQVPVGAEASVAPVAGASTSAPSQPGPALTVAPVTSAAEPGPDVAAPAASEPPVEVIEFLAVLDDALIGTPYAGAPFADPDVFVATGRLLCDELALGEDADTLLADYLELLTGGPPEGAADHDLVLAGSLLGAAAATLCPEHLNVVASD